MKDNLDVIDLPIADITEEVLKTLNAENVAIVEAPPGAGKSTLLPLRCLEIPSLLQQKIVVLQPRRVAARATASRMAELLGENVGQRVGYQIRNEKKSGPDTRIEVVTEGILTRRLQSDPSLKGVGLVVFDEFHERNLQSDLGLALCECSREYFRDTPLKLLLMSATLNAHALEAFWPQARVLKSAGRMHPITIHYHTDTSNLCDVDSLSHKVVEAVNKHSGSILVFLPGAREIDECYQRLGARLSEKVDICRLHGSLPFAEQKRVLAAPGSTRKIVLATDIAETSLTIEGIEVVVDSGWARAPQFDPKSATSRLTLRRISRASADQRAGRAGRLGPGHVYRMWTEDSHHQRLHHHAPEILNSDIAAMVLLLLSWEIQDPAELRWVDPPPSALFNQALDLLERLNALATRTPLKLSDHGKAMAALPLHPRLSHMLLKSAEIGAQSQGTLLAAVLSDTRGLRGQACDIRHYLEHSAPVHPQIQRDAQRLSTLVKPNTTANRYDLHSSHVMPYLLAQAFPDRIAHRHKSADNYQLANGRRADLPSKDKALSTSPWLVIAELGGRERRREDSIFHALPLPETLLETHGPLAHLIREHRECRWLEAEGRLRMAQQQRLGAIVMHSRDCGDIAPEDIRDAVLTHIRKRGIDALPWDHSTRQWRARVICLHRYQPDENWPDLSDSALMNSLDHWLTPFLNDLHPRRPLASVPLAPALQAMIEWSLQAKMQTLVPEEIEAPSGRKVALDYQQDPPAMAVKLQEMFGAQTTPSIIQGRCTLSLHLLSPAGRPLQVTRDLGYFWQNSYHEVAKEMRGRYPKHPWPDNPESATPAKGTKKQEARRQQRPH